MTIRLKVKEIKINGWRPIDSKIFAYLKPQFIPLFLEQKNKYILQDGEEMGSRFLDNETVWYRIISGLWNARWEPFDLSQKEIRYLIDCALKDCARADWYYNNEKDWR